MKNFDACKGMKELLGKAQAVIPELEAKISAAENAQAELDAEAIKAQALEAKDAKKKTADAEANRQTISRLRDEIAAAKKKIEIIEFEANKLEGLALEDVRTQYRPGFEKALREFVGKAKDAAKAEAELHAIKREAGDKMDEISRVPHIVLPPIARLLLAKEGDRPEYGPLARLIADCKAQGIDLG